MSRSVFVVVVALIAGSCLVSRVRAGETGVQAVESAWLKAMKANSMADVAACYAKDAIGWFPGAGEAKGREAIRAGYEAMFAPFTVKDATLSDTHQHTAGKFSTGWGKFTLTLVEKATDKTVVMSGRFTEVAELRKGRWVYILDHASAEPAPASEASSPGAMQK